MKGVDWPLKANAKAVPGAFTGARLPRCEDLRQWRPRCPSQACFNRTDRISTEGSELSLRCICDSTNLFPSNANTGERERGHGNTFIVRTAAIMFLQAARRYIKVHYTSDIGQAICTFQKNSQGSMVALD